MTSTRSSRTWKDVLRSERPRAGLRAGAGGAATTREDDGWRERRGSSLRGSSLRGSGVGSGGGRDSSVTSGGVPPVKAPSPKAGSCRAVGAARSSARSDPQVSPPAKKDLGPRGCGTSGPRDGARLLVRGPFTITGSKSTKGVVPWARDLLAAHAVLGHLEGPWSFCAPQRLHVTVLRCILRRRGHKGHPSLLILALDSYGWQWSAPRV